MALKHLRLTGLALVLVVAAIAAPSASAYFEHPGDSLPGAPLPGARHASPPTQVRIVDAAPNPGFDWGDAGIGAGAGFALTMIGLGGALVVSNRRHGEGRAETTA